MSGEKAEDQVLLTADGRQMDHRELIGSYSVGTVSLLVSNLLTSMYNVMFHGRKISLSLSSTEAISALPSLPALCQDYPRVHMRVSFL